MDTHLNLNFNYYKFHPHNFFSNFVCFRAAYQNLWKIVIYMTCLLVALENVTNSSHHDHVTLLLFARAPSSECLLVYDHLLAVQCVYQSNRYSDVNFQGVFYFGLQDFHRIQDRWYFRVIQRASHVNCQVLCRHYRSSFPPLAQYPSPIDGYLILIPPYNNFASILIHV